ncbi:MAG: hypothetical protein ACK4N5_18450, partial [Myxococcales bacterium]
MRAILKVLLTQGTCNFVAILWGLGFAWFALIPALDAEAQRFALQGSLVLVIGSYCVGSPTLYLLVRPIKRAMDVLGSGRPDPAVLLAGRRRALELPIVLSRTSMLLWILPAAVTLGATPLVPRSVDPLLPSRIALAIVLTGAVSSTFVLYLVEHLARRTLVPMLLPDGDLDAVPGVRPASTGLKLLILIGNTCLVPVLVL